MKWGIAPVIVMVLLVLIGTACAAKGYANGYSDGRKDGWADCNAIRQFVAGFTLNVFYVGYCVISPGAAPPAARMAEIALQSNEYQEGYIAGYDKGWSSRRLRNAVGGAASSMLILLLISGM